MFHRAGEQCPVEGGGVAEGGGEAGKVVGAGQERRAEARD